MHRVQERGIGNTVGVNRRTIGSDAPSRTSLTCTDLSPEPEADLFESAIVVERFVNGSLDSTTIDEGNHKETTRS